MLLYSTQNSAFCGVIFQFQKKYLEGKFSKHKMSKHWKNAGLEQVRAIVFD